MENVENCVIDTRVSDDKQLLGNGLDDQIDVCQRCVNMRGWNIVHTFANSHSGRKVERKDFEESLQFVYDSQRKGVKIHYYVVKSIDRFTRNGGISYSEMKERLFRMGVQLIDAYGVIQPVRNTLDHLGEEYDWSVYSPSETAELVEATRSKAEVRDILTRMIGAEINLTRKGFSMRSPNDGYKNAKKLLDGTPKSVLVQDGERAYYYKKMFELRASGTLSDKEIVEQINALGFKSKPRNIWKKDGRTRKIVGKTTPKPLTVKQLQKVVLRTMYAGVRYEKWTPNPVRVEFLDESGPIVTIKMFNDANRGKVFIRESNDGTFEVLYNYHQKNPSIIRRKKYNQDYLFDKMICCPTCKKPFINSGKGNPGKSGKRYKAYHCDRTFDNEKHYLRIAKQRLEDEVLLLLNNLKFKDGFLEKLEQKLIKKYREREKEVLAESIKIGANVNQLKIEQESLLESLYATNSATVRKYTEEKIDTLQMQIDSATNERDKVEIKERDIKAFVKFAKDLMEHPAKMLADNRNPVKQQALFDLFFVEPLTYTQVVNGTPKLTLLFKLSEEFKDKKSSLVSLIVMEPK